MVDHIDFFINLFFFSSHPWFPASTKRRCMTRSCFKNAGNYLHHCKIHAGIFSLQILFVSRETVLSQWWFGVVNECGLDWFICGVGLKWQVDVIKTPFNLFFKY